MKDLASINKPKLLEQVRIELRAAHYSPKTEESYLSWIKRFILFHNKRHPKDMGAEEIKNFINYLANNNKVSSSTQNQALQAILYLYKNLLNKNIGWIDDIKFTQRKKHLPTVLNKQEVKDIFNNLTGVTLLIAKMMYGSGMRLGECLKLRLKDIDMELRTVTVRDAKGEKDRITILPDSLLEEVKFHIAKVKNLFKLDQTKGNIVVALSYALSKKYPNANKEIPWQYLFPAKSLVYIKEEKLKYRVHLHPSTFQKEFKKAARKAGVIKQASPHTLRHSFATHLPREIIWSRHVLLCLYITILKGFSILCWLHKGH